MIARDSEQTVVVVGVKLVLFKRASVWLTALWAVCAVQLQSSHVHADERDRVHVVIGEESTFSPSFSQTLTAAAAEAGLNLKIYNSDSPLDSIGHLFEREQILLAVVPSDFVNRIADSPDPNVNAQSKRLRLVYPLETKQVHLLASRAISTLQQLGGKRVVVGTEGSNHWITATNILKQAGVAPAQLRGLETDAALRAVLQGDADAMFFVGHAPVDLFADFDHWQTGSRFHKLLQDAHFLPIEDARVLAKYDTAWLSPKDYGWNDQEIATVSITELLITQNHADADASKEQCDKLSRLGNTIKYATRRQPGDHASSKVEADDGSNNRHGIGAAVRGLKSDTCSKVLHAGFDQKELSEYSMKNPEKLIDDTNTNDTFTFAGGSESEATGTVDATVVNALQKCLIKGECE